MCMYVTELQTDVDTDTAKAEAKARLLMLDEPGQSQNSIKK